MEIIEIDMKDITPYWRNPRINRETIPAIKKSIERYGFKTPITLDKDLTIISGHARFKAAMDLGWDKIPCVIADIDGAKAKELRILDNKIKESTRWDAPALQEVYAGMGSIEETMNFFEGSLDSVMGIKTQDMNFFLDESMVVGNTAGNTAGNIVEEAGITCPYCLAKIEAYE